MARNVVSFLAVASVLAFLATTTVALRFWAHTKTGNRFGPDDVLIIPALLGVVAMAVTEVIGTQLGGMAQQQQNVMGPDGWVYTKQLEYYEKCNYILQLLSVFSLGFSKASVLCFYRRVFYVYPRFLVVNNILMVIIVAWAISFFFTMLFQCRDPRTLWTTFEYERVNCVQTLPFYYALASTGFITDIMILASPLPIIRQLKMPMGTRIAAAFILLLGAIVCSAGIIRFVTFLHVGRNIFANIHNLTYFTTPVFSWSMVETSLAVVSANLPLLRPLLHHITRTCSWVGSHLRSMRSSSMESSSSKPHQSPGPQPEPEPEPQFEFAVRNRAASMESCSSIGLPKSRFDTEGGTSCTDNSSSFGSVANRDDSSSSR